MKHSFKTKIQPSLKCNVDNQVVTKMVYLVIPLCCPIHETVTRPFCDKSTMV